MEKERDKTNSLDLQIEVKADIDEKEINNNLSPTESVDVMKKTKIPLISPKEFVREVLVASGLFSFEEIANG